MASAESGIVVTNVRSGLADVGRALPVAQGAASLEEGGDRSVTVEGDVPVVEFLDPGGFEQGLRLRGVADVLAVGVGVTDEVLGGRIVGEQGGTFSTCQDDHGVVEDGRPSIDLLMGGQQFSVAGDDTADLGSNQLDESLLGRGRLA